MEQSEKYKVCLICNRAFINYERPGCCPFCKGTNIKPFVSCRQIHKDRIAEVIKGLDTLIPYEYSIIRRGFAQIGKFSRYAKKLIAEAVVGQAPIDKDCGLIVEPFEKSCGMTVDPWSVTQRKYEPHICIGCKYIGNPFKRYCRMGINKRTKKRYCKFKDDG